MSPCPTDDTPVATVLQRRPILLPGLLVCAAALALGLALRGRPLRACHFALTLSCAAANLLSAWAAFARARQAAPEARGWRLLGGSLALLAVANAAAALDYRYPTVLASHNMGPVVLGLLSQGLGVLALLAMPWRPPLWHRASRNLLGSCLFVGSILLILWTLTNWEAGFQAHNIVNLALVAACVRLTLLGGLALLLVEQNPQRMRGVLGFVLVNVLLGAFYVALLQALLVRGVAWVLPFASVFAVSPLILGLAAWSRAPLEASAPDHGNPRVWLFLPYATFALAAVAFYLQFLATGKVERYPLAGFLALTWLLLYRQFLLLKELRVDKIDLEARVHARTMDLEHMQAMVLRTERLNTTASLGAGLTHDLNNYLSVIGASAHMIQQSLDEGCLPEPHHLGRIQASTDKAAALTTRLMGFARRDPNPPRVLDLGGELGHMEDLLQMILPRNIQLRMDLAPGPCPVLTRRTHLEQILVNLVSNAKDAMPSGGTITLRLDRPPAEDLVRLVVADDGPGLPPVVQAHAFEFFLTTKPEGQGTGLGLATVKALMDEDRGTIGFASAPGEGCTFTLTWPRA